MNKSKMYFIYLLLLVGTATALNVGYSLTVAGDLPAAERLVIKNALQTAHNKSIATTVTVSDV